MKPTTPEIEEQWRRRLVEGHRPVRVAHALFKHLPSEPRCKLCHNPFGGVGGAIVARFGYRPSPRNPNMCSRCCDRLPPGGAEVELAILFADVRGSTALGERMGASEYAEVMRGFYLAATRALIRHDAIIDKLIGDEVMALFIPGIAGQDYRRKAALAALDLLTTVGYGGEGEPWMRIGVGVHSGTAYVGNVGADTIVDFTALGDAVNTAARLQGQAEAGVAILSEDVYDAVADRYAGCETREVALSGKEERLRVRALRV